jgi:hypothetical protein
VSRLAGRRDSAIFRYSSDSDNGDLPPRSHDKPSDVVWVACENHGLPANGCDHHSRVNDIRGFGNAEQPSCLVRFGLAKRNDLAPGQEASELGLL